MSQVLVRVESQTFVAGYLVDSETNRVTDAAPILRRWVLGKTAGEAKRIVMQRGWTWTACDVPDTARLLTAEGEG